MIKYSHRRTKNFLSDLIIIPKYTMVHHSQLLHSNFKFLNQNAIYFSLSYFYFSSGFFIKRLRRFANISPKNYAKNRKKIKFQVKWLNPCLQGWLDATDCKTVAKNGEYKCYKVLHF